MRCMKKRVCDVAVLEEVLLEALSKQAIAQPRPTYYLRNVARQKIEGLTTPAVRRALVRMEKRGKVERTANPYGGGKDLWWCCPSSKACEELNLGDEQ